MATLHLNQLQVIDQIDKNLYSAAINYDGLTSRWQLLFTSEKAGMPVVFIAKQRGGTRWFKTADAALRTAATCGFHYVRASISELDID